MKNGFSNAFVYPYTVARCPRETLLVGGLAKHFYEGNKFAKCIVENLFNIKYSYCIYKSFNNLYEHFMHGLVFVYKAKFIMYHIYVYLNKVSPFYTFIFEQR